MSDEPDMWLAAPFTAEGVDGAALPKWLSFQCQGPGAEPGDVCMITVNGQRNGSGASWKCAKATRAGALIAPTVNPSIRCVSSGCHFNIEGGKAVYHGDHKGHRRGF